VLFENPPKNIESLIANSADLTNKPFVHSVVKINGEYEFEDQDIDLTVNILCRDKEGKRLEIYDLELENLCKEFGLNSLLKKLPEGLNTFLRERGGNLSSGERQLLSVARVVIRNPVVLIMDEATAFMDPSTEATLQKDLERILSKRTALVIAHRLATIESSDKILVLKGGSLVEEGTHSELRLKKGLYFQLSELQQKGFVNF